MTPSSSALARRAAQSGRRLRKPAHHRWRRRRRTRRRWRQNPVAGISLSTSPVERPISGTGPQGPSGRDNRVRVVSRTRPPEQLAATHAFAWHTYIAGGQPSHTLHSLVLRAARVTARDATFLSPDTSLILCGLLMFCIWTVSPACAGTYTPVSTDRRPAISPYAAMLGAWSLGGGKKMLATRLFVASARD